MDETQNTIRVTVDAWAYFDCKGPSDHYRNILATAIHGYFKDADRVRAWEGIAEVYDAPETKVPKTFKYAVEGRDDIKWSSKWMHGIPPTDRSYGHRPYFVILTLVAVSEDNHPGKELFDMFEIKSKSKTVKKKL